MNRTKCSTVHQSTRTISKVVSWVSRKITIAAIAVAITENMNIFLAFLSFLVSSVSVSAL